MYTWWNAPPGALAYDRYDDELDEDLDDDDEDYEEEEDDSPHPAERPEGYVLSGSSNLPSCTKFMIRVLNLGAGVQSTTIYLMACANKEVANACFGQPAPKLPYPDIGIIDYAVFADTQDEPEEVYRHVTGITDGPPAE